MRRFAAAVMLPAILLLTAWGILTACRGDHHDRLPVGTEHEAVILLYHHFSEKGADNAQSADGFAEQLDALLGDGYTFVTVYDLWDFVQAGTPLPDKTAVLMADDGYQSVLDVALPIARERQIPLTAAVIGVSDGRDTYRDTGISIIPHFSAATVRAEGLYLVSHGFDGHMGVLDEGSSVFRRGLLRRDGEQAEDYRRYLTADKEAMDRLLDGVGDSSILAYPYGLRDGETEAILRSLGIRMTFTTEAAISRLTVGDADCLFGLPRITVDPGTSGGELLSLIGRLSAIAP